MTILNRIVVCMRSYEHRNINKFASLLAWNKAAYYSVTNYLPPCMAILY